MSECEHHDYTMVEDYIRGLQWSPAATDHEKSLVAGNIRGFYEHARKLYTEPTRAQEGLNVGGNKRGLAASDFAFVRESPVIDSRNIARGTHSIAMGTNCKAIHPRSILIGHGLESDYECQVKIGTAEKWIDLNCTEDQTSDIRALLMDALSNGWPKVAAAPRDGG